MKSNKLLKEIILLFIAIVPLIYYIYLWNSLPARIPVHFDLHGNPNNYGSRYYIAYTLLFLNIGTYLLLLVIPKIDSKKNFEIFSSTFYKLRIILSLLFSTISFMIISSAQTGKVSNSILYIIIAFFISILGNYISNVRPNYFLGIRNPWTLENEFVWRKTHKFGGRLMFFSGILIILTIIALHSTGYVFFIFITWIIIITLITTVYSYWIYKKTLKTS